MKRVDVERVFRGGPRRWYSCSAVRATRQTDSSHGRQQAPQSCNQQEYGRVVPVTDKNHGRVVPDRNHGRVVKAHAGVHAAMFGAARRARCRAFFLHKTWYTSE